MPLKEKHLDALCLADFKFENAYINGQQGDILFIKVREEEILDLVNFLEDNFKTDSPFMPLRIDGEYYLYVNNNDKNKI